MSSMHSSHIKTSMIGEHVDAYFNSDIITSQPAVLNEIVKTVLVPFVSQSNEKPDWIVSYAPYGLFIAYSSAEQLNTKCGYTIPQDNYKTDFKVPKTSTVLVVADDMYSGSGVAKTITTLEQMGVKVLPFVFCLANLTGSVKLGDRTIVSAVSITARRYPSDNCEFCKKGSKAVLARPNWDKVTEH